MSDYAAIEKEARIFTEECVTNNRIDPALFAQYDIKRGLRDKNGNVIYVGKAKILKNRVRQYFYSNVKTAKVSAMVAPIVDAVSG